MAQDALSLQLKKAQEIIKDKLFFACLTETPKDTATSHFFTIDSTLVYTPFYADFGPLNLAHLYRFSRALNDKLKDEKLQDKKIYFYCGPRERLSNASVLIGGYSVIYLGKSAAEAYKPLKAFEPYVPFRDAGYDHCTFELFPKDVVSAVEKGLQLKFFDFDTFDVHEYEKFEQVENGDLNVIIPGKFIGFASPAGSRIGPDGFPAFTPDDYAKIFEKFNVKTVVRLNMKVYDHKRFTALGFKFHHLYFDDGTTPSQELLEQFIQISETHNDGVIAVHCKAGLGRTGTMIGCYMMKHYGLTAEETIAWIRLARPGSVVGPQQEFLRRQQPRMWKAGRIHRQLQAQAKARAAEAATTETTDLKQDSKVHVPIQPRKGHVYVAESSAEEQQPKAEDGKEKDPTVLLARNLASMRSDDVQVTQTTVETSVTEASSSGSIITTTTTTTVTKASWTVPSADDSQPENTRPAQSRVATATDTTSMVLSPKKTDRDRGHEADASGPLLLPLPPKDPASQDTGRSARSVAQRLTFDISQEVSS